jgi:hypothetical protein
MMRFVTLTTSYEAITREGACGVCTAAYERRLAML